MADTDTQISKSKAPSEGRQVFHFLYWTAYDKIWSGRAMRAWEIFFWIPLAAIIGFQFAGYVEGYQLSAPVLASLIILLVVTPFVVGVWAYKAYFSMGKVAVSLMTVPLTAFSILLPRFLAVLATVFQFFLPIFVLLIYCMMAGGSGFGAALFILLLYAGGVCFLTGWAFLSGSLSLKRGGNFFLWYFVPVVIIGVPIVVHGGVVLYSMAWSGEDPTRIVAATGLFGYIGGLILFMLACKTWEART